MLKEQIENVKLTVVYYSSTGTNYELAKTAAEHAEKLGAEVRLRKAPELAPQEAIDQNEAWKNHLEQTASIPEASPDDMEWANAFILGTPTRFGNASAQLKNFMDSLGGLWFQGKLADKAAAAFTSAANPHGGQESTLLALYNSFHHWGVIPVAPGYTDQSVFESGGNPYGLSVTAGGEQIPDEKKKVLRHLTHRLVSVADRLAE